MVLLVHIKKNITPNILAQLFNLLDVLLYTFRSLQYFPFKFFADSKNFFLAVDSYTTQLNLKVKYMYMYVSKEVMTLLFFRPGSFKCFMQTKEGKCSWGLNSLVERYLFEQKLHGGKRIPRGFYHAVMTKEESEDFDCWRKVRKGKSRRRSMLYKCDKTFKFWLKETHEECLDVESILGRVDVNGWVQLSVMEQHQFQMWKDFKWEQLEQKGLT